MALNISKLPTPYSFLHRFTLHVTGSLFIFLPIYLISVDIFWVALWVLLDFNRGQLADGRELFTHQEKHLELANYGLSAQFNSPPVFIKFYWNSGISPHLHIVYDCCRNCITHKAQKYFFSGLLQNKFESVLTNILKCNQNERLNKGNW